MFNKSHLVDFHTHVLPKLDHGSDSVETTAFQLSEAIRSGFDKIIATSHFYPHVHSLEKFLEDRAAAYQLMVEKSFPLLDNPPKVKLAAEVLVCPGFENFMGIEKLCIHGTKTLLLELPFQDFSAEYVKTVEALIALGYDVVLAHADRYPPADINRLIEKGAGIQLNADALFCNLFLGKKHIREWLKRGVVVALGSDIHGTDKKAYQRLLRAEKNIGKHFDAIYARSLKIFDSALDFDC